MNYKVIPFTAKITKDDNASSVANQLQSLIDANTNDGWTYLRLENVETFVAADAGCFGLGAKPAYTTTFRMAIFQKWNTA